MNPEEKVLLERTLKLSEENNEILKKMRKTARLALVWGLIKVAIIIVPLIIGYIYLEPYIGPIKETFDTMISLLSTSG